MPERSTTRCGVHVVPNHHRVVPQVQRTYAEILQYQHGVPCIQLGEQRVCVWRENVRDPVMASRGGDQFDLERALAFRQVGLRNELRRCHVHAG